MVVHKKKDFMLANLQIIFLMAVEECQPEAAQAIKLELTKKGNEK